MKKSKIKNQLKKDLESRIQGDFDAVWNKCGVGENKEGDCVKVKEAELVTEGAPHNISRNKKSRLLALLLAVVLVLSALTFVMLHGKSSLFPFASSSGGGYFIIDINPSVELTYGKDGKITGVKGLNKDGETLLIGSDIVGKTYEEASEVLFKSCVELGYFSPDRNNNAMLVSAIGEDGKKDEKMTSVLKDEFSKNFVKNKIYGVVITGIANAELENEAKQYGIDGQKLALIKQYLAIGGELDESEYGKISVRELYTLISDKEKEIKDEYIKELNEELADAKEDLIETVTDKINDLIESLSKEIENLLEDKNEELSDIYEEKIDRLEKYLDSIDDSENTENIKANIDLLLNDLKEMSEGENDSVVKAKLDAAIETLCMLNEEFDRMTEELLKLESTAKDNYTDRINKYKGSSTVGEDSEDAIEKWQEEQEEKFENDWLSVKMQWNKDRESDLDD